MNTENQFVECLVSSAPDTVRSDALCEGGYERHVQQQFDRAALADLTGLSIPTTN